MGNASRTELCCLMGRIPGDSPEASFFRVWLRLLASLALPAALLGKLRPSTPTVETKFDLQRHFLSGLGVCGVGFGKKKSSRIRKVMTRIFPWVSSGQNFRALEAQFDYRGREIRGVVFLGFGTFLFSGWRD